MAVTFSYGGLNINDGTVFKVLDGFDPGEAVKTFSEYRGYDGSVKQVNVTEAKLVKMHVPLRVSGANLTAIRAAIATINALIDDGEQDFVFDDGSGAVTYRCLQSPRIVYLPDPGVAESLVAFVDLVLYRDPVSTGGGSGGMVYTPIARPDWMISVLDYGAIGNGTTDDTTAIQNAIDDMATDGGGTLYFPPGVYAVTDSLVPKSKVLLLGSGFTSTNDAGYEAPVRIVGDGGFAIFDSGAAAVYDFGMDGFGLIGSETDSGSRGIYAENANNWTIRNVFGSGFANQGMFIRGGVAGVYENIWMQRACMKRADHSTYVGAVQFGDATHYLSDPIGRYIGGYCSYTSGYGSGYHCGLLLGAPNGVFEFCQGSWSETGIKTLASVSDNMRLTNCRADHNRGHGFDIAGQNASYLGCIALNNSRATDATYSGFRVRNGGNTFSDNWITETYGFTEHHLYGFEDDSDDGASNLYGASNRCGSLVSGGLYHVTTWAALPGIMRWNGRMLQLDNPPSMDGVSWSGTGLIVGTAGPCIISGALDPSAGSGVAAVQGSIFMRTDGGASTSIYIKTGAADTAWTAK
jgi:hypothetical protein